MNSIRNWINMEDIILLYKTRQISIEEANMRADGRRTLIIVAVATILITIITIGVN